jgi:hypothetical protein
MRSHVLQRVQLNMEEDWMGGLRLRYVLGTVLPALGIASCTALLGDGDYYVVIGDGGSLGADRTEGLDASDTAESSGAGSDATIAGADAADADGSVGPDSGDDNGLDSSNDGGEAGAEGGACGPQTCSSGCCDAQGSCTVTSASTCGSGGVACQNCASAGQICSNGSCSTPVAGPDSGQACTASTCLNLCVPYFHQCCKADQACGCSINSQPGPCQ